MLSGNALSQKGLSFRPMRPTDHGFIESLYHSTRDDLKQLLDAESEFIEDLIDMQFQAQHQGYGDMFPNAMHFIIEKLNERIGRAVVDFGSNEIRLVDIALIPQARNQGYGSAVLRAIQMAAAQARAPVTLTVAANATAAQHFYHQLGFQAAEATPTHQLLVWYPQPM